MLEFSKKVPKPKGLHKEIFFIPLKLYLFQSCIETYNQQLIACLIFYEKYFLLYLRSNFYRQTNDLKFTFFDDLAQGTTTSWAAPFIILEKIVQTIIIEKKCLQNSLPISMRYRFLQDFTIIVTFSLIFIKYQLHNSSTLL